jgi:hypothetical protein
LARQEPEIESSEVVVADRFTAQDRARLEQIIPPNRT